MMPSKCWLSVPGSESLLALLLSPSPEKSLPRDTEPVSPETKLIEGRSEATPRNNLFSASGALHVEQHGHGTRMSSDCTYLGSTKL